MASKSAPNAKKGKDQYVMPHPNGGWQVVGEGNSKATVRTKTEEDAIRVAKEIAWNQGSKYIPYEENKRQLKKKK